MASGGAPPVSGDPRLLFEYLDDPDFHTSAAANAYAAAAVGKARRLNLSTGADVKELWDSAGGAVHSTFANGLCFWKCSDNVATQGRSGQGLSFPTSAALNDAPVLPSLLRRHKRFTLEMGIYRDSIGVGGGFFAGLRGQASISGLWDSVVNVGIEVSSRDTELAGRYALRYRMVANGPLTVVDTGIDPVGAIRHLKIQMTTGPVRSLVVTLEGVALKAFTDAELPKGLDAGNLMGMFPLAGSKHTGAGTFSGFTAARFAVELLA